MEMKRSEILKIISQDKKKDNGFDRAVRLHMYKDIKSRKRDKTMLIIFDAIGLFLTMYGVKETSRIFGVGLMFISSILSILV